MIFQTVAVGLATFRVSVLLSEDRIASPVREFLFRLDRRFKFSPFYAWANCAQCNGVWFAVFLWVVYDYFPVVVWLIAAMGVQVLCLTLFKMSGSGVPVHGFNHEVPKEDTYARERFMEIVRR
jgi:hypothetical protein